MKRFEKLLEDLLQLKNYLQWFWKALQQFEKYLVDTTIKEQEDLRQSRKDLQRFATFWKGATKNSEMIEWFWKDFEKIFEGVQQFKKLLEALA